MQGLTFKCGGGPPGVRGGPASGCPSDYVAELQRTFHYRSPHSGIMIAPPSDGIGVNTLFADNHLHDLCQGTADAGGFYAGDSWANRGNVVRGNRFERLFPTEKMAQVSSAYS